MNHGFNYRTELGGWVCKCQRYFDTEEDLNRHIKEEWKRRKNARNP